MTGYTLKIIALIIMTLDHIGLTFDIDFLRYIGRISFPIYAFLTAEGIKKSSAKEKYLLGLLVCAVFSEPIYDMWLYAVTNFSSYNIQFFEYSLNSQNVLFTLFIGASVCYCLEYFSDNLKKFAAISLLCLVAYFGNVEYSLFGVAIIVAMYYCKSKYNMVVFSIAFLWCIYFGMASMFAFSCIGVYLVTLYNGERGKYKVNKYFFYLYYPIHIMVLFIIWFNIHY